MSSVFHSLHTSRRASALKDSDYDHEIYLIDRTKTQDTGTTRSRSASEGNHRDSLAPPEDISGRRHSDDNLRKKLTLREEIERRRYSKPKYQVGRLGDDLNQVETQPDVEQSTNSAGSSNHDISTDEQPKPGESLKQQKKTADQEPAIDILFENQRGGFLCGIPLFSSKALGAADKPPWTNAAQKASATDITNAQVPDPSWKWAWKEWKVNHGDIVDEDGWEYSLMFSKKFSWHGPTWYNSFVRRRAWIRKRVKKNSGYHVQEVHRLNSDYFTIHPSMSRSRSPSKTPSVQDARHSISQLAKREMEELQDREDIRDIVALMKALKLSRIDREKTEAVENFIKNGGDDLYYLREHMHEIMSMFIFQASRRLLLAHLSTLFGEEAHRREEGAKNDKEDDPTAKRRFDNLEAAVQAADEEVKRLEFWSDIKGMVKQGATQGAVDGSQGWDRKKWAGVDDSAPKDVISDRELLGSSDNPAEQNTPRDSAANADKGKGKA